MRNQGKTSYANAVLMEQILNAKKDTVILIAGSKKNIKITVEVTENSIQGKEVDFCCIDIAGISEAFKIPEKCFIKPHTQLWGRAKRVKNNPILPKPVRNM